MSSENDVRSLLREIRYGSGSERIAALIKLGQFQTSDVEDEVLDTLADILTNEHEDGNIRTWAAITLARLGATVEPVKDSLLHLLEYCIRHPDQMSPVGMQERAMAEALSKFEGDHDVTERLMGIVRSASNYNEDPMADLQIRSLINHCLRAIAAIGCEEGRGMLEHWRDQGNSVAAVALRFYGQPWAVIRAAETPRTGETRHIDAVGSLTLGNEEGLRQSKQQSRGITEGGRGCFLTIALILAFLGIIVSRAGSQQGASGWSTGTPLIIVSVVILVLVIIHWIGTSKN